MSSILRLHANEPGIITRALDCGVNGIAVPHITSKEEAERVVRAAKFYPIGQRVIFAGRRSYKRPKYFEAASDETLILILIVGMRATENLAEILTVDHIDAYFIAPGDLSQTMCLPMQIEHPKVVSVVDTAIRRVVSSGRIAAALGFDDMVEHYISLGVRPLFSTFDGWIKAGALNYLSLVGAHAPPNPPSLFSLA